MLKVFKENTHLLGRSIDSDIICDLSKEIPEITIHYNQVIHCAGKAHSIPNSNLEIKEFFEVNLEGTANLLKALSNYLPDRFVFVSTVAVYGVETGEEIAEDTPLKGETPYAKSKIEAEKIVLDWGKAHNVPVLILRLPLIVGMNPPGNLGKMIEAIRTRRYFNINKGAAKRSMVLANDVADFIHQDIGIQGIYNLTDGYHPSYSEIEAEICRQLGLKKSSAIPNFVFKIAAKLGDYISLFPINSDVYSKMSSHLTFDDSKARAEANWSPHEVLSKFEI